MSAFVSGDHAVNGDKVPHRPELQELPDGLTFDPQGRVIASGDRECSRSNFPEVFGNPSAFGLHEEFGILRRFTLGDTAKNGWFV